MAAPTESRTLIFMPLQHIWREGRVTENGAIIEAEDLTICGVRQRYDASMITASLRRAIEALEAI